MNDPVNSHGSDLTRVRNSGSRGFSIFVACYNDGALISSLLESILLLNRPSADFEIIIADNASVDQTREICLGFSELFKKNQIGFQYLYASQQGKSTALNKAAGKASYDVYIFTDADAKLDPNYLVALEELISI